MLCTVRTFRAAALAACCMLLLAGLGCAKKHIYSEPARYDHGTTAQSSTQSTAEPATRTTEAAPVPAPAAPEPQLQSAELAEAPAEPVATKEPVAAPVAPEAAPDVAVAPDASGMTGLASWIADDFQGLRTASGELYDKDSLTASHRTLPLGSRVEVTNLENGRFTEVRINDRGPLKQDRVISVSRRAAEELGMLSTGLARVRLRELDGQAASAAPAAAPATAPAAAPAPAPERSAAAVENKAPAPDAKSKADALAAGQESGSWFVQVGAFQDRENAKQVLTDLYAAGYAQSRISKGREDGYYRVQAGGFATREDAESALETLRARYPASYVISTGSARP